MNYNAINTKLAAMSSRLLKYSDYYALSQLENVDEVGNKLKERHEYKSAVESIGDVELRRTNIEQKLVLSLSDDFSRIYKFLSDHKARRFLDAYFLKNEVNMLKILLCSIYDSHEVEYSLPEINALITKKMNLDAAKLKNSKSVSEFIDNLNGSPFYKPLHDIYTPKTLLYELEMQLDLHYYIELWKLLDLGIDKENTNVLRQTLGYETDLRNISWILRLKAYYNVPSNKIYSFLIPFNYNLQKSSVTRMVEAKSNEALLSELALTPYGKAFQNIEKPEKVFTQEMLKVYAKLKAKETNSLAATFAYLFQKELEIKNITSLIECVRYKLDPKDIFSYLTVIRGTEVS